MFSQKKRGNATLLLVLCMNRSHNVYMCSVSEDLRDDHEETSRAVRGSEGLPHCEGRPAPVQNDDSAGNAASFP